MQFMFQNIFWQGGRQIPCSGTSALCIKKYLLLSSCSKKNADC